MTDRELLEYAAKAAGIVVHTIEDADGVLHWDGWNPLTDDGDALRLAVKLRIHLDFGTHEDVPYVCAHRNGIEMIRDPVSAIESSYELDIIDWNVATRRAIVRAAAEIGKGMV